MMNEVESCIKSFTVRQLTILSDKGDTMTLNEHKYMLKCIDALKEYASIIVIPEKLAKNYIKRDDFIYDDVINGVTKQFAITPTQEQYKFIRYILPSYLSRGFSHKIQEVLNIYELDVDMEFSVYMDGN
jgi:hypothetical protein